VSLIEAARPTPPLSHLAERWLLAGACLLAMAIRIYWAFGHGLSIEQEGAEYARIAQNLLAGKGYVGIFNNGVQLNFPPLYPMAIAAVSLLLGDAEVAARAINIVLGSVVVLPVFRLADMAYGRRAAVLAVALVVLHPMLIASAASTYSEGVYWDVVVFGLWMFVQWATSRRVPPALAAGLLFGAAYLIRPEAFVLVGLLVGGGLVAVCFASERRRAITGPLVLLGAFVLIALPNVAFLTYHTGKLRIEAKGTLAYEWGRKINQGMSYAESVAGVGADLSDEGVFMRPNLDVLQSAKVAPLEYAQFILKAAQRNAAPVLRTVSGEAAFGSPLLFALVALGLFAAAWSRQRLLVDGVLVGCALTYVLVLLAVQELWLRYFFGMLGMMLFWAAAGAQRIGEWGEGTLRSLTHRVRIAAVVGQALMWLAVLSTLLLSLRYVGSVDQFHESEKPARKEAGLWLARQDPTPRLVMSFELQVPYYAGADMVLLPYASSDQALRYIAKRKPDYIVLVGGSPGGLPYTKSWFVEGIPSAAAKLVYDRVKPGSEHVKIYRWNPESSAAGG
jgi:4-amino-4-deoxy-L-arabinose transferase-like glycosyltransferase